MIQVRAGYRYPARSCTMEVHNEPTGSHHTQEKIMADTKNSKPALDLAALVPTDAEVPTMQRERKHRDNPFVAWLSESYSTETGKSVTVPAANVGEVEYLIRRASDDLGIGARVVVQNSKGETLDKDARKNAKGNLTVLFAGKDRKSRRTAEQVAAESATA